MKFKTTRKAIVNGSSRLVSAGYCDLATLLRNHSPIAYTCGVYEKLLEEFCAQAGA